MISSIQLLEAYQCRHGCRSQRQMAAQIGISQSLLQNVTKSRCSIPIDKALDLALELGLNQQAVLIGNLYERTSISARGRRILADMLHDKLQPKAGLLDLAKRNKYTVYKDAAQKRVQATGK